MMVFYYCSVFLSFYISTFTLFTGVLSSMCRPRQDGHRFVPAVRKGTDFSGLFEGFKMFLLLVLCFCTAFSTSYYWNVAGALWRGEQLETMMLTPFVCSA